MAPALPSVFARPRVWLQSMERNAHAVCMSRLPRGVRPRKRLLHRRDDRELRARFAARRITVWPRVAGGWPGYGLALRVAVCSHPAGAAAVRTRAVPLVASGADA